MNTKKSNLTREDLELGVVCPDGVRMGVNWNGLSVGASVFIPAVDTQELRRQVYKIAYLRNMKLKARDRIEAGKLGVRFWRVV